MPPLPRTHQERDAFSPARWRDKTPDSWTAEVCGQQLGPLDRAAVLELIDSGSLLPSDRLYRAGSNDWISVANFDAAPLADSSDEQRACPSDEVREPQDTSLSQTPTGLLPDQYFLRDGLRETGPLPIEVLIELAEQGTLRPTDLIRREDSTEWQAAAGLLRVESFPTQTPSLSPAETQPTKALLPTPSTERKAPPMASVSWLRRALWTLLAPLHFVVGLSRLLSSASRLRVVAMIGVLIVAGYWIHGVYWNWSLRVGSGSLLMDGKPMPSVMVTLTNISSGEMAIGFSGASGHFSLKAANGRLSAGRYRVTINRPAEYESPGLPAVPDAYRWLATSKLEWVYDGEFVELRLPGDGRRPSPK